MDNDLILTPGHVLQALDNKTLGFAPGTPGPEGPPGPGIPAGIIAMATGFSTASATTGVTTNAPAGAVASLTHDAPSNEPPFFALAYIQKLP